MTAQLTQIKEIIIQQIPEYLKNDKDFQNHILDITNGKYAEKEKTEDRIDRILDELRHDREKSEKKWEENQKKWEENQKRLEAIEKENQKKWDENRKWWDENQKKWEENQKRLEAIEKENQKKWDENRKWWDENQKKWEENQKRLEAIEKENQKKWDENRKWWEENQKKWEENQKKWEAQEKKWEENQKVINGLLLEVKKLGQKHDSTIGALGARWGIQSEKSFRDALKSILEDSFHVKVEQYLDFDEECMVFDEPDQVEMDVIIHNGTLILCEIKSSISQSEIYTFWRKKKFYEKKHSRKADRLIVISPMVSPRAMQTAKKLGIEVFSYANDVVL